MAQMDGGNAVEIVSGLSHPIGIAIDFDSQRLFWVDYNANNVQLSNMDATDVQLLVQLSSLPKTGPWGIAITEDRLFWGNEGSKTLQRSDKAGQDIVTLYNGTQWIHQLVVAIPNSAK